MKKLIFVFGIALLTLTGCKNQEKKEMVVEENMDVMVSEVVDDHNSQNSLDWAGVYEGVTPCADCEGIKIVLELNNDNTYSLSMTYLGKPLVEPLKEQGEFTWDKSGSKVSLKTEDQPIWFKVGENQVWMLDGDKNIIKGDFEKLFILKKSTN
ncbi:copper resistance protein NlpE [Aequorivita viscosa]|uniref:Uncharacterized lipoprotein NlpE involved in copper resistance n=1 Tax=Aequorivita viscosa TaxID=797419 RepID=A0A1M6A517_9FLAO|nr:copper resistance protein NlpE [Aequorivita viscosa]SDW11394.1 Uncharacterized lipoprotein NlpE involved in copper resistance [Aequorivita viscosa]SHI31537.1 Uncharacterized lipoprotein NlpE involved in copper resistance [Aequorivita viscosa]